MNCLLVIATLLTFLARLVHSSYVEPYKVIRERAIESSVLASSNYRVLGNILADDRFISNWLEGKAIATKGALR